MIPVNDAKQLIEKSAFISLKPSNVTNSIQFSCKRERKKLGYIWKKEHFLDWILIFATAPFFCLSTKHIMLFFMFHVNLRLLKRFKCKTSKQKIVQIDMNWVENWISTLGLNETSTKCNWNFIRLLFSSDNTSLMMAS